MTKLTTSQKEVLQAITNDQLVSGRKIRSLRKLQSLGMVRDIQVHPKFDPVKGYAMEFYSAKLS